jgi:hypothetical protein
VERYHIQASRKKRLRILSRRDNQAGVPEINNLYIILVFPWLHRYPGYENPGFWIEFMYKARNMIISYRPEHGGIWRYHGIPQGHNNKYSW